jgi:hypothetical protein
MAETESTAKSDTGPPLPSLVELCLRSVEGLVLSRPQELPAVAACLGVLPRSAVSQFVESLLLRSMTGLYPLPCASPPPPSLSLFVVSLAATLIVWCE